MGRDDWDALCDNHDPETGKTLTARQKANRRIGYDFNFHVPKSVSVAYTLNQDERILDAYRAAVGDTMVQIEAEMKTRVRAGGRDEDRTTGNMVWGEFVHFTARPVDGLPAPHLHAHCFAFNTTYDDVEGKWKAGQFSDLKRDAPFFEAVFHSSLAAKLRNLEYGIERTKNGWELAGVPTSVLRKFSRRTARIEEKAREAGIDDPHLKDELGAGTREKKNAALTLPKLREEWRARLSPVESAAIEAMKPDGGAGRGEFPTKEREVRQTERITGEPEAARSLTATQAVDHALLHSFERTAVVPERVAQAEAIRRAYGAVPAADVLAEFASRPLLAAERNGRRFVTTAEVLVEERRMIDFAREGRGTCAPLGGSGTRFSGNG